MIQCPVCGSDQFAHLRGPRRTVCPYCQASWIQDDDAQNAILEPREETRPASRLQAVP